MESAATYQHERFRTLPFTLLPGSFPEGDPSWYRTTIAGPVRPDFIEEIQFLIDTSDAPVFDGERYGFEIESAWLERAPQDDDRGGS